MTVLTGSGSSNGVPVASKRRAQTFQSGSAGVPSFCDQVTTKSPSASRATEANMAVGLSVTWICTGTWSQVELRCPSPGPLAHRSPL